MYELIICHFFLNSHISFSIIFFIYLKHIIQYYTLYGAYFINNYLRLFNNNKNNNVTVIKNPFIENIIVKFTF